MYERELVEARIPKMSPVLRGLVEEVMRRDRPTCFGGYVTTITVEHDGGERHEAVPCWRCQRSSSGHR
jgi:hypothetical protein